MFFGNVPIDDEAKPRIDLFKCPDRWGGHYYRGKYQWPGTLDFEEGVCFMVFVSEEGAEEMQVSPLDFEKRSRDGRPTIGATEDGKLVINLRPFTDKNGRRGFVGEAIAPVIMPLRRGAHFSVFTEKRGREEIHIGRLDHAKIRRRQERQLQRVSGED